LSEIARTDELSAKVLDSRGTRRDRRALKDFLAQLDKISERYPDDKEILFIKGAANAMGHNLDYPGCAEKAMAAFDRLLRHRPE